MPQVFSPRANAITRWVLTLTVASVAGIAAIAMAMDRSSYNTGAFVEHDQPIVFPHRHHVDDDGIGCKYCHSTAEFSSRAGMPSTQTCMNCHAQIWSDAPYLEPVRASWRTNTPIRWTKVHDLPDFVYFEHSPHVNAGVGCSTCHGNVAQMTVNYQVAPLTMAWCLDCHNAPERALRPRSEIYNPAWQPGANQRAEGLALKAAYGLTDSAILTSCSTCHR
jgi:hypothetical protein